MSEARFAAHRRGLRTSKSLKWPRSGRSSRTTSTVTPRREPRICYYSRRRGDASHAALAESRLTRPARPQRGHSPPGMGRRAPQGVRLVHFRSEFPAIAIGRLERRGPAGPQKRAVEGWSGRCTAERNPNESSNGRGPNAEGPRLAPPEWDALHRDHHSTATDDSRPSEFWL